MNNRKILLIDYDPTSISRTATPLTNAGYSVEVAKDGLSGLAAFERMKPALVLVEAMLPRKHGFEVCQEIKAKPGGKATPVLITSAVCRGRKYRMDALQIYGCDEYIEKPIPDAELVSMIERLIQQADEAREEIKRDLSEAIEDARPAKPDTLDSMSDDELEAKIDSLLMGDVFTESAAEPEQVDQVPAPDSEPEFDTETEMERRVKAMVQVETPEVDAPAAPLPVEVEETIESLPVATEETVVPAVREWAETTTPKKKGGSKKFVVFAVAVAVLAAAGFLAYQRGWLTRSESPVTAAPIPQVFTEPVVEPEPVHAEPVAEAAPVIEPPTEPRPVVPEKPVEFKPRSSAQIQAAANREHQAEQAMQAAAGLLQSELLTNSSEPFRAGEQGLQAVEIESDLIGLPEPPRARRGDLYEISEVDRIPVPMSFKQPRYDELARRMRHEGEVLVSVLIDENGAVTEVRLLKEIPRSRLNDTTVAAAERWTYRPAIKDDVPVKVWKTERIVFSLK